MAGFPVYEIVSNMFRSKLHYLTFKSVIFLGNRFAADEQPGGSEWYDRVQDSRLTGSLQPRENLVPRAVGATL